MSQPALLCSCMAAVATSQALKPSNMCSTCSRWGNWVQVLPVLHKSRAMTPIPSSTSITLFVSSTPCHFSISGRNTNHQPLYTDYLIPTSALAASLFVLIHQYLPKPLLCSFLSHLLNCVSLLFAFPAGSLSTELPKHVVSHLLTPELPFLFPCAPSSSLMMTAPRPSSVGGLQTQTLRPSSASHPL